MCTRIQTFLPTIFQTIENMLVKNSNNFCLKIVVEKYHIDTTMQYCITTEPPTITIFRFCLFFYILLNVVENLELNKLELGVFRTNSEYFYKNNSNRF